MTKRLLIFFLATFLGSSTVYAQLFGQQHDSLKIMMERIAETNNLESRNNLMRDFATYFERILQQEGSMNYAFDSIPYVGKLASDDGNICIYTWSTLVAWGRHQYYGILQWRNNDSTFTMSLNDVKRNAEIFDQDIFITPNWYGNLYYQILEHRVADQVYYTLLGFEFNNSITYKKSVDILHFEDGKPTFGIAVLNDGSSYMNRLIFEYASSAQFFMRYLPSKEMIIFNRLIPQRPELSDDKRFYVPSEICDGLQFRAGKWEYVRDVMVTKEDME